MDSKTDKPTNQVVDDPEKPLKKDLMTILVTVSAAFLALAPVLLILQPMGVTNTSTDKSFSIASAVFFAISFIIGIFTIARAVDWFKDPDEAKNDMTWLLIRLQTMFFAAGSFLVLILVLLVRFGK